MRHVVGTNEVSHLWMHQTQRDARNKQGNFFFDRDTIYSYGNHFPIARHITNKKGQRAILFTTRRYSSTTAGHICQVRYAIPKDATVFHVRTMPSYSSGPVDHAGNWESYLDRMKKAAKKAKTARKYRDSYLAEFAGMVAEANAYAAFFGLGKRYRIDASKDIDALVAEFNANRAKIEKAERAKKAKEAKARENEMAERIEQWKRGEYNGGIYGVDRIFLRLETEGDTLAGPGGQVVVTSQGARFPLDHGVRAFKLIAACRSTQKPWERNGHTIHLGHYAIDRIEPDGTVKAGCHRVEWAEIERIARAAGVLD